MRKRVLNVKYVSLVNLIAVREVVTELVADTFSVENIKAELLKILDDGRRAQIQDGYAEVRRILGEENAPENAANIMYNLLNNQSK
jgi:lipid-A-disaccharide synthase